MANVTIFCPSQFIFSTTPSCYIFTFVEKPGVEAVERTIITQDWITLLILGTLFLLVLAKEGFYQRFTEFAMLFATNKYLLLRSKDTGIFHPFSSILFLVNILSVSLFAFLFYDIYTDGLIARPQITFLRIMTAYTSFILLKFAIEKIAANILDFEQRMEQYQFYKLTYRNFLSLGLIPLNILFFYVFEPSLGVLYFLIGLILFLNFVSLIGIFRKNSRYILSNVLYFILYLCALEIGPYFILYKLVTT